MNKPRTYRARQTVEAMLYDGTRKSIEAICQWANETGKRDSGEDPWIDFVLDHGEPEDVICHSIYGLEAVLPGSYVVWDGNTFFAIKESRFHKLYQLWSVL